MPRRSIAGRRARPSKPEAIQTTFARRLAEYKRDLVPLVARLQRPVLGNAPVSPEERRRRFWQAEKGWTPEHEADLLAKGMTPQDVGLLKYGLRELDSKAAGRADDPRAQAKYVDEMAKLGPPPPEPLAQAALDIERRRGAAQPGGGAGVAPPPAAPTAAHATPDAAPFPPAATTDPSPQGRPTTGPLPRGVVPPLPPSQPPLPGLPTEGY